MAAPDTDRTNYYEVVPKNALEMAMWMESDRMGYPDKYCYKKGPCQSAECSSE